jgi:hypothetical protein
MRIYSRGRIETKQRFENNMFLVKEKEPLKTITGIGGLIGSYGIFELVQASTVGKPSFALQIKEKPIAYVHEVEIPNQSLRVLPVEKTPWPLASETEKYDSEETLWNEIRQFIYDHLDLPSETDYHVLTAWIFATWLLERWIVIPFLNFYGSMETGKSKANEILAKLSFRGWNATFVTAPSLFRVCENWHPCLCLDETETILKNPETVGLLNASYRKGTTVPRQVPNADGTFETQFFETFGFRALSGTHALPPTLASRSIVFHMRKAVRPIKLFINEDRARTLRNKLLAYRFKNMLSGHEGLEGDSSRVGVGLEEFGSRLGNGRLAELFYCLWQVAPTEELKTKIIDYAQNLGKERLEELAASDEGLCLNAIVKCFQTGKITHGLILIKDIADEVNRQLAYNETWTHRKIGSICSRLGFRKAMSRQKTTCIKWDKTLIESLKKDPRYASCFEQEEPTPTLENAPSPPSSISPDWIQGQEEVKDEI